jgi:hypothetical protein
VMSNACDSCFSHHRAAFDGLGHVCLFAIASIQVETAQQVGLCTNTPC